MIDPIAQSLWDWCLLARDAVDPEARLAARVGLATCALVAHDQVVKETARGMLAVLKRREQRTARA